MALDSGAGNRAIILSSFELSKLVGNAMAFFGAIQRAKPSAAKGKYMKSVTIATTMGPGILLDADQMLAELGRVS